MTHRRATNSRDGDARAHARTHVFRRRQAKGAGERAVLERQGHPRAAGLLGEHRANRHRGVHRASRERHFPQNDDGARLGCGGRNARSTGDLGGVHDSAPAATAGDGDVVVVQLAERRAARAPGGVSVLRSVQGLRVLRRRRNLRFRQAKRRAAVATAARRVRSCHHVDIVVVAITAAVTAAATVAADGRSRSRASVATGELGRAVGTTIALRRTRHHRDGLQALATVRAR